MKGVETEADWVTALADGGYTTNVGLEDVTDGPRDRLRVDGVGPRARRVWRKLSQVGEKATANNQIETACRAGFTALAFDRLDLDTRMEAPRDRIRTTRRCRADGD